MKSIVVEEKGDEGCERHLWHVYLDGTTQEPKYRECNRCWRIQKMVAGTWEDRRNWLGI